MHWPFAKQIISHIHTLLFWQLIKEENVKGVVSMNEDYELWLFSNNGEVKTP
jgi:hypothetical protein